MKETAIGVTSTIGSPNHRREYQSEKDVGGKPVKTVARLTTSRWTSIGDANSTHYGGYRTSFAHTYFIRADDKSSN